MILTGALKEGMKTNLLPERVYLTQIKNRWGMEEIEIISHFIGRNIVFAMLENVQIEIILQDRIWEAVKEKGIEAPQPKSEYKAFLRVPVLDEYLETIIKGEYWQGPVFIHGFEGEETEEIFQAGIVSSHKKGTDIIISFNDLYVHSDDLLTVEKELGIKCIFLEESVNNTCKNIAFLDTDHVFHAKELKIAVEAWIELYEKNPPSHVPRGGHKKYITKWLEKKHPELGQRAQARIATVINPNPKGGASPIN